VSREIGGGSGAAFGPLVIFRVIPDGIVSRPVIVCLIRKEFFFEDFPVKGNGIGLDLGNQLVRLGVNLVKSSRPKD
jgi:hypothetical protein